MEVKTITVDVSFLNPDSVSSYEYERFMGRFRKKILEQAIVAGDVKVAIHILGQELIGEDTSDSGEIYEEMLETALYNGDVKLPMLEAIIASLNDNDDALEYLSESGSLKRILLRALTLDVSPDVIQALANIRADTYWMANDIEEMMNVSNSEGLNIVLAEHPIEDEEPEILRKLQELEEEIIAEDDDPIGVTEALARINLIRSHVPEV